MCTVDDENSNPSFYKLSDEVKATYRETIERYLYSFRFLSEEKLRQELRKEGLEATTPTGRT